MSASHDSKTSPQNSFKLFTEKEIEDFLVNEDWNDYHGKIETLEADTVLFQQKIEKLLSLAPKTINRLMQEDIKAYAQIKGVAGLGAKETALPMKQVEVVDEKDPSQTYDLKVPDLNSDKLVNFADWHQEKYLLYHFCFLLNGYIYYKKTKSTLDLAIEKEELYLTLEEEMRLALNAYQVRKESQRLLLIEDVTKRKNDLEKLVAEIISQIITNDFHENYIPCGWIGDKGHALYLAIFFLKESNEIVIRIDNSGREEATILGGIKVNQAAQKKQLINYLVDAISQLIETNGELAKAVIYNTQQSKKYNFAILQNNYDLLPKQKIPNYVVEGYRRGMWYRLLGKYGTKEDALYHWLLRKSEEYAVVSHDVKQEGAKQIQLRERDRRDNQKLNQRLLMRYNVSSMASEEKSSLIEKIKTWRERIMNDKERQADLALYIASTVTERVDDEKLFDLEEDVRTFLKSESRVMLLLGSSGLGKTLFGYYLEQQLWKAYKSELSASSQPIPLFISLARLKHPNTEAIEETLKAIGFEEKEFTSLKKLPFLFILDGADEINVRSNLYSSNKLDAWSNAKLMFTCRLEYLMQPVCEYRNWFQPSSSHLHHIKKPISEIVVERFMAPFSLDQIENYLKKYIEQNKENLSENWSDWKQYWHYFNKMPGLLKLIESPYLLYIASSALPELGKQQNLEAKSQEKQEITRLSVYDAFVKYYFLRHIEKSKQHELSNVFKDNQSNIEETLLKYNQQIAIKLYEIDQVSIAFQPEKVKAFSYTRLLTVLSAISPWAEFFGQDSKIQSKLLASPIKKTGDNHYAFLHPSLRDYFIARELFDQLVAIMPSLQSVSTASGDNKQIESHIANKTLSEEKVTQQILQSNPNFKKLTLNVKDKLLRYERQVLDFIVERLAREPEKKAVLWAIIERSKQDAEVAKAAANAITILNAAGISFASRNLRKINIPGADLSSSILDNTQLQGANLTQVNLQGSWLCHANLSGAQLKDVNFGELPLLSLEGKCRSVQYSPNGRWLAMTSGNDIIVYDAQSRECIQMLKGHTDEVRSVAWDHESRCLASGSSDKTARLWDTSSGKELWMLEGHKDYVTSVAWDHESKRLVSGSDDNTVRLWETSSGKQLRVLQGHTDGVRSVAWDHESKRLASGSDDKTVRLWEASSGKELRVLQGHTNFVTSVAWDHKSTRLASGSWDKTLRLWEASSGKELRVLQGHTNGVNSIAWDHESKRLASGSADKTARLWEASSGKELRVLQGHTSYVNSVAWNPESKRLASGSGDNTVRLWEVSSGKELRMLHVHTNWVRSVAWDHESKRLASGSKDKMIRLWEASSGKELRVLQGHTECVTSVAWDHESKCLASGSDDYTVRLWEASSGKELRVLQGHTNSVISVAWDHESKRLASGSYDKTVRLCEASSGRELRLLQGHTDWVRSVTWDRESKRLASGSDDNTVRLWEASNGKELRVLQGHTSGVTSVAWDGESKRLASGSTDKTVRLWEASSGKELRVLQGHTSFVNSVAWDPESKYLASGSDDKTVRIWEVATGNSLGCIQFPYSVQCCAWATSSPDQERLAVAFGSGIACFTLLIGRNSFKAELNWLAIQGIPTHAPQVNITGVVGLSVSNQLLLEQHNAIGKPAVRATTASIDSKDAKDSKQVVTTPRSTSTATAATATAASSADGNSRALFAVDTKSFVIMPVNNNMMPKTTAGFNVDDDDSKKVDSKDVKAVVGNTVQLPPIVPIHSLSESKKLAIGNSDFKSVVESGALLIDKSLLIKEIIDDKTTVKLIIRARRFGKTLNMSMLKYFFEISKDNTALFRDKLILKEGELYKKFQGAHPVLYITFKDINDTDFDTAKQAIKYLLAEIYKEHKKILFEGILKMDLDEQKEYQAIIDRTEDDVVACKALKKLTQHLCNHYNKKVILLMDEYDTPIYASHTNGYYTKMADYIRKILSPLLKDNNYLEQAVLTGVLRVAKESIFSGLNNIRIYSVLSDSYANYFGFTANEVKTLLGENATASMLNLVEDWYGGYQIGSHRLFNPWSIVHFIEDNQRFLSVGDQPKVYKPYWLDTSENIIVEDLFKKPEPPIISNFKILLENKSITEVINEHTVFSDLDKHTQALWSFLLLTGYLSMKTDIQLSDNKKQLLIPNRELYDFYVRLINPFIGNQKITFDFKRLSIDDKDDLKLTESSQVIPSIISNSSLVSLTNAMPVDDKSSFLRKSNPRASGQIAQFDAMKAIEFFNAKLYDNALVSCNEALKYDPENVDYYKIKIDILFATKQHDEITICYDEQLKRTPANYNLHQGKCEALIKLRRIDEAVTYWDKMIAQNPKNGVLYLCKGNTLMRLLRFKDALISYDLALGLRLQEAVIYSLKGTCHFKLGEYQKSIEYYDKVLMLNTTDSLAHYNKGNALFRLRQFSKALICQTTALRFSPDHPDFITAKALLYFIMNEYAQAEQVGRVLMSMPVLPLIFINDRANILYRLGRFSEAAEFFNKFLSVNIDPAISDYWAVAKAVCSTYLTPQEGQLLLARFASKKVPLSPSLFNILNPGQVNRKDSKQTAANSTATASMNTDHRIASNAIVMSAQKDLQETTPSKTYNPNDFPDEITIESQEVAKPTNHGQSFEASEHSDIGNYSLYKFIQSIPDEKNTSEFKNALNACLKASANPNKTKIYDPQQGKAVEIPLYEVTLPGGNSSILVGDVVALAGDFFSTDDYEPIGFGATTADSKVGEDECTKRFKNAYSNLFNPDKNKQQMVTEIVAHLRQEAEEHHEHFSFSVKLSKKKLHEKTSNIMYKLKKADEKSLKGIWHSPDFDLALKNFDNFGDEAKKTYITGHKLAIQQASEAGNAANPAKKQELLKQALLLEMFACHFLTDLFAAGHLRTPRKELLNHIMGKDLSHTPDLKTVPYADLVTAGFFAKKMHDEDGKNGVYVKINKSAKTKQKDEKGFIASGDGNFFKIGTNDEYALRVCETVVLALGDLFLAFQQRMNETILDKDLLSYLPYPDAAKNVRKYPLFSIQQGQVVCRGDTKKDLKGFITETIPCIPTNIGLVACRLFNVKVKPAATAVASAAESVKTFAKEEIADLHTKLKDHHISCNIM